MARILLCLKQSELSFGVAGRSGFWQIDNMKGSSHGVGVTGQAPPL